MSADALRPNAHVLFALPDEAKPFFGVAGSLCGSVTVSGVGAKNTEVAVHKIVERYGNAGSLIVIGFCGGLVSEAVVGSLVVVESVCTANRNGEVLKADSLLLEAAESVRITGSRMLRGAMVSVPRVLVSVEEKAQCHRESGAIAVDMETYSAARTANECGLRWMGVRVVTDGAEQPLPIDFNAFADECGNPDRGKIAMGVLLRPWLIPSLIRLGRHSSRGARLLKEFLVPFLNTFPG